MSPLYPDELVTLGDYLRKVRLDRGLSQIDVGNIFNVTTDAVTSWELNRNEPTFKFASKIIQFLGFFPFDWKEEPLHIQLKYARMVSGMTQKHVAESIGIDSSNLRVIELGKRNPYTLTKKKIYIFIAKFLT